jgi:hypothetical protein
MAFPANTKILLKGTDNMLPDPQMLYTLLFKPDKAISSRAIGCFSGPYLL